MTQAPLHPFLEGFCAACKPADRRPLWQWCEQHVQVDESSPFPGKWRSAHSPWVKPILDAFADNAVRTLAVQCAAQGSKTQTALCCLLWLIAEDPGPAMWVAATRTEIRDLMQDRLAPTLAACPPVRARILQSDLLGYRFVGMPFYTAWAGSKARLQGKPIRWLFCDEVRNYPPGRLEMVRKRTRAYSWNSRQFLLSTPGHKGDAMDSAFQAGNQQHWHFECPACHQLQPLKFEQLKWDKNDQTRPAGRWNFDALAATVRLECVACGHALRDTPATRRHLASVGRYVALNPAAPRDALSFTWNALLPPWVPWRSVVAEFLSAVEAMRAGDIEPMFTFVTETLGEPWDLDRWLLSSDDHLLARRADYDFGDRWPLEQTRFLAADKQARGGEHYYWVCRAFGPAGQSRLVGYGRCSALTELEAIRRQLCVPLVNCILDSGFQASEVYRFCLATGWKALKGDDAEWFPVHDPRLKRTVRQVWRLLSVDPNLGATGRHRRVRLPLYQWSNPSVKDHLALFTHGVIGQWALPRKIGRDYLAQMTAEVRESREDSRGHARMVWVQKRRDNHYLDCELQIHVGALIAGVLRYVPLDTAVLDETPEKPAPATAVAPAS